MYFLIHVLQSLYFHESRTAKVPDVVVLSEISVPDMLKRQTKRVWRKAESHFITGNSTNESDLFKAGLHTVRNLTLDST